jgi:hypothetical protein
LIITTIKKAMNNSFLKPTALASLLALLTFIVAGCETTKPQAWNLTINKTTPATIEIDLIGVTESDKPFWTGYNLDKYWSPNDPRRLGADKLSRILEIGQPWIVYRDDPKWAEWLGRGATDLLLIANLPGQFEPGFADPRRILIPLDRKAWDAPGSMLEVEVQESFVRVLTRQIPRN